MAIPHSAGLVPVDVYLRGRDIVADRAGIPGEADTVHPLVMAVDAGVHFLQSRKVGAVHGVRVPDHPGRPDCGPVCRGLMGGAPGYRSLELPVQVIMASLETVLAGYEAVHVVGVIVTQYKMNKVLGPIYHDCLHLADYSLAGVAIDTHYILLQMADHNYIVHGVQVGVIVGHHGMAGEAAELRFLVVIDQGPGRQYRRSDEHQKNEYESEAGGVDLLSPVFFQHLDYYVRPYTGDCEEDYQSIYEFLHFIHL